MDDATLEKCKEIAVRASLLFVAAVSNFFVPYTLTFSESEGIGRQHLLDGKSKDFVKSVVELFLELKLSDASVKTRMIVYAKLQAELKAALFAKGERYM